MDSFEIDDKILRSIPQPWGKYAINSLVEDYVYYSKLIGITPDTSYFKSSVELVDDGQNVKIQIPYGVLGQDEATLVWNNREKRWDGFKEILSRKIESNLDMLSKFPGSEQGLKKLFSGPGFMYDGRKINFRTYMGIVNVVLDTFEGQQTISIDDPEGSYIWDPQDVSWSVLD